MLLVKLLVLKYWNHCIAVVTMLSCFLTYNAETYCTSIIYIVKLNIYNYAAVLYMTRNIQIMTLSLPYREF